MRAGARVTLIIATAAVVSLVVWAPPAVHAQTSDDLFDSTRIHEVRVTMHPRDLALFREHWQENTFYPATVVIDSVRVRDAAVRNRGLGSRNPHKQSMEVEFDRYVAGRRVLGLSGLVLDNLWQDESMVREALAFAVFNRAGTPAPRYAYARMFVNNEFQGLFAIIEPISPAFLSRVYSDNDGYLYEFKWLFTFRATYLGDDLDVYKPVFEPRSHEDESDDALYGPLRDLFRTVNESPDDVWRSRVEEVMNLDQLARYIAIEAYVAENDGFLGYDGLNNHYWYRPSGSGRHQVLPWDKDQAFIFLDSSIFRGVEENELVRRALAQPDLRELYLNFLDQIVGLMIDGDWFKNELERFVALITPVVEEDTKKQFSTDAFFEKVDFIRMFADVRPGFIRDEVRNNR